MTRAWQERVRGLGLVGSPCFRGAGADALSATSGSIDPSEAIVLVPVEAVNAWPDRDLVVNFLTAANRYFEDEWLRIDRRFRLATLVSGLDPVWSAEEVRRSTSNPSVVAAALPPMQLLMGDTHYFPLYEACAEAEVPIVVYPSGAEALYVGAALSAAGVPASEFERRVVLTQIAQANVTSLVFGGVFSRFPRLRVIFAGFGFSWLVALNWRMDMDWRRTRIETPWVQRPPSEYVKENLRFTTTPSDAPTDSSELEKLLAMVAADRVLLYGSDTPRSVDDGRTLVEGLPAAFRDRVAAESARELYALPVGTH
jgi:predicted TIM-barrel fold metal-dependent hydrolase